MSFTVTYAGHTNDEYGLMAYARPAYIAPSEIIDEFEIPGREYDLHQRSGRYEYTEMPVTFNYVVDNADEWGNVWRKALVWLHSTGNYQQSDDMDIYRKVVYVRIDTNEREVKRLGRFDATFVCYPGEYLVAGADYYTLADLASKVSGSTYTIINEYSQCRPVFRLTGNGQCTLTVNDNAMTCYVDTDMSIDTDLKIAYRESTSKSTPTAVTGDYDGLVLVQGENTIKVSGSGISKWEIQPNWVVR